MMNKGGNQETSHALPRDLLFWLRVFMTNELTPSSSAGASAVER